MENNEIMNNDIIEEGAEMVASETPVGFKVAFGVGVALLVGGIIYKKVIAPAIAKHKAKKEEAKALEASAEIENEVEDEIDEYEIEEV